MEKENLYFKNRIIILYPFHFVNITPDGKYLTGSKFRSLKIRHLPFHPDTVRTEKPSGVLKALFGDLFKKFHFVDGFEGMGYSVHQCQEGKTEETIAKIKEDIELLYYAFEKSNNTINPKFPKFYLIKDVVYFKDKIAKFHLSFYEEYVDPSISHHVAFYGNETDKNHLIYFKSKTSNLYQPSVGKEWEKFFAKREIPLAIYWGVYWYNKAKDETSNRVEKIVYLVIALENILDLSYQNTDNFAQEIKNELGLNSGDSRVCVFCSFIRQAHRSRCGIVHGLEEKSKLKLRGEWGKEQYFNLDFYLSESFKIILDRKISGQLISDFRINNLLERVYPNKSKLDDFAKLAKKVPKTDANDVLAFKSLRGFKEHDNIGIDSKLVSEVVKYINSKASRVFSRKVVIESLASLIKGSNGWEKLRELAAELEKQDSSLLNAKTIDLYIATDGLVDFLNFLSNFVLYKNIEYTNKKLKK